MKKILRRILASENLLLVSIIALLFTYFVYHTISGDRGVLESFRLSKELEEKNQQLEEMLKEKSILESKLKLLNSKSLDLDLLDELARKQLGLIGRDEVIIYPKK